MSAWDNQSMVDQAVSLWKAGVSHRLIAEALNRDYGVSLSKQAVTGKLHRLDCRTVMVAGSSPVPRHPPRNPRQFSWEEASRSQRSAA